MHVAKYSGSMRAGSTVNTTGLGIDWSRTCRMAQERHRLLNRVIPSLRKFDSCFTPRKICFKRGCTRAEKIPPLPSARDAIRNISKLHVVKIRKSKHNFPQNVELHDIFWNYAKNSLHEKLSKYTRNCSTHTILLSSLQNHEGLPSEVLGFENLSC